MKAVLQRVTHASVKVDGNTVGEIEKGFLILLGVAQDDSEKDADYLAKKCVAMRIFEDDDGKMNLSLDDVGGAILAVSQFTLCADCRKGKRPNFTGAANGEKAQRLYEYFVQKCRDLGARVQTGKFGADMKVELLNDGPVTILMDTEKMLKDRG